MTEREKIHAGNIYWPSDESIMTEQLGYLSGKEFITRQDASLIIFRALGLNEGNYSDFADYAEISDYAKGAVSSLFEKNLILGVGEGLFAPKELLTRAQAAQLIYNALK